MNRKAHTILAAMTLCSLHALAQSAPALSPGLNLCNLPPDATITLQAAIAIPRDKDFRAYASRALRCRVSGNRNPIAAGTYQRHVGRSNPCTEDSLNMRFRTAAGDVLSIQCNAPHIRQATLETFAALIGTSSTNAPIFSGTVEESSASEGQPSCGSSASDSSSHSSSDAGLCTE